MSVSIVFGWIYGCALAWGVSTVVHPVFPGGFLLTFGLVGFGGLIGMAARR